MSEEKYVDPNSGAASQPGGYAAAPVQDEGQFDAAVADEVTEAQEEQDDDGAEEASSGRKGARKATARRSSKSEE